MSIFYNLGEKRNRPGIYMRYSTRDDSGNPIQSISRPDSKERLLADRNGIILKTADGKYLAVKL